MLGPLLYLIFINDLVLSNKNKIHPFADDANFYAESVTISEPVQIVNQELKLVKNWINANLLSLNISKTNYILFHSPVMSIPSDIVIKIGREHTNRLINVNFLGLLLYENIR